MNRRRPSLAHLIASGLVAFGCLLHSSDIALGQVQETPPEGITQEQWKEIREEMEHGPKLTLAAFEMPAIDTSSMRASAEELAEIESLIERLQDIDVELLGGGWDDGGFVPLRSTRMQAGLKTREGAKPGLWSYEQVRRLIELGPKALPALLDHIDDQARTQGVVDWERSAGLLSFERELPFNTASPRERKIKVDNADALKRQAPNLHGPKKHEITVGDVCFQIIGQIVNRSYVASRYQPTGCAVVNSPTHDEKIAELVRNLWRSDDPARMLFESLWTDLHTRGRHSLANTLQSGAVQRLMFWFPDASAGYIADRIDGFDASAIDSTLPKEALFDAYRKLAERNGVSPASFIESASLFSDPRIDAAILRTAQRTTDPSVLRACLTERIVELDGDNLLRRLEGFVRGPTAENAIYMKAELLRAAVAHFGERARPLVEEVAKDAPVDNVPYVFYALSHPPKPLPWADDVIAPYLKDTRETKLEFGPDYDRTKIRVCDSAAQLIVEHVPGAKFVLEGTRADLDAQIADIERMRAGQAPTFVRTDPAKVAGDALAAAPLLQAKASCTFNEAIGGPDPSSTASTLVVGQYKADDPSGNNCWQLLVDVGSCTVKTRVPYPCCGIGRPFPTRSAEGRYTFEPEGAIVLREPITGAEVRRFRIPFTPEMGLESDPETTVSMFGGITLTRDATHALVMTKDSVLHDVDLRSGQVSELWKAPPPTRDMPKGMKQEWNLEPLFGSDYVLLEATGFDRRPVILFNYADRTFTELQKMPSWGWSRGWGPYAHNILNNCNEVWDVRTQTRTPLEIPGTELSSMCGDPERGVLYAFAESRGIIVAIDAASGRLLARMEVPRRDSGGQLTLSNDGSLLFWSAFFLRGPDEPQREEGTIAIYDVSSIAK